MQLPYMHFWEAVAASMIASLLTIIIAGWLKNRFLLIVLFVVVLGFAYWAINNEVIIEEGIRQQSQQHVNPPPASQDKPDSTARSNSKVARTKSEGISNRAVPSPSSTARPVEAANTKQTAQGPVSPGGNQVLVVWRVGSPTSNQTPDSNVPLNLERKAESMGFRLQIHTFPAREFAQAFQNAFSAHEEPDIIAVENATSVKWPGNNPYGIVPITSDPDVRKSLIQVNGSLSGIGGGWQFLISTSQHAEAARRLALRPAECDASAVAETPMVHNLQQAAVQIANAYLRTPTEMRAYDDVDRLRTEGAQWDSMNVRETMTCGYWGNDRLAFVSVVSTFEHEDPRGQPPSRSIAHGPIVGLMPILLVLRKQDTQWRLLAASSDPVSNGPFLRQVPVISRLLQASAIKGIGVAQAHLLSPEDGHVPAADAGQRFGNFTWQSSPSGNVVAEIVEFAYKNDDRLFFLPKQNNGTTGQVSAGSLWTTGSEWKWRVWSISDTGAIAFSDYRTFRQ
jgi:hypothetical protein